MSFRERTAMEKDREKVFRGPAGQTEPLAIQFKRIDRHFASIINAWLRKDGITYSQLVLLHYLERMPDGQATQKEIGEALHITHPTCIGLIRRLSCKKLVEAARDPMNRRFRVVRLRKEARVLLRKADEGRRVLDARAVKGFTKEETALLHTFLDRMEKNLSAALQEREEL